MQLKVVYLQKNIKIKYEFQKKGICTLSSEQIKLNAQMHTGIKLTKEHKEKISKKLKGKRLGYKHTDEAKEKIRAANIGKKLTQEHKDKIGSANRGKKYNCDRKGEKSPSYKTFTIDELSKIKKLYIDDGLPEDDIGKIIGCGKVLIKRELVRMNIKRSKSPQKRKIENNI